MYSVARNIRSASVGVVNSTDLDMQLDGNKERFSEKFQVLTAMKINIMVFWVMTSCSVVSWSDVEEHSVQHSS
jgi:hypothetical protein